MAGLAVTSVEWRGYAGSTSRVAAGASMDVAALYRTYGDMVLARCRTLLRNDADAQDAAQDTFLRAFRYADGFRGDSSPSTWLFRIATTTCLNRIRTRKRHPEDLVDELPHGETDGMIDAFELKNLLDELARDEDERTWQCVVHFYLDGMTHDEIGELTGVTGAAVRKRIGQFRARARARPELAFLAGAGAEEDP
jgi:RNA polymerase sigma-70 factor (ECF subfamily)